MNKMEETNQEPLEVKEKVDNFEAVIASGDVKLIAQNGEVKLYQGTDGIEYIYDGSNAYSENTDDFAQMKVQYFS